MYTLNDYSGDGTAAVLLINFDGRHDFTGGNGWFSPDNLLSTGVYLATVSRDEMREEQQQQLVENRKSSTSKLFQLYWTLTTCLNPNGVINWANGIFKDLFTASGDSQGDVYITSQTGLLKMTTPNSYLNIVTIDNIRDNNVGWLTSLTIGISRLYATCPQVL